MNILHLDSSVTGDASVSRPLTAAATEALKAKHPDAEIVYRDLIDKPLRHYTAVLSAHGATPDVHTTEQKNEYSDGKDILAEFLAADIVVVGAPMYNFSVPSQLKAWIDLICVAGQTFQYGANGAEGLCGGKQVVVVSTRGGLYGPGSPVEPMDHQAKYLRDLFGFLGVTNITVVQAEGVSRGGDMKTRAIEGARAQIAAL